MSIEEVKPEIHRRNVSVYADYVEKVIQGKLLPSGGTANSSIALFSGILNEQGISERYGYRDTKGNLVPLNLDYFLDSELDLSQEFFSNDISLMLFENLSKMGVDLFKLGVYGAHNSKRLQSGIVVDMARLLGPTFTIKKVNSINSRFNKTKFVELVDISKNTAVSRLYYLPGICVTKEVCQYNQGWYWGILDTLGFLGVEIREQKCVADGDAYCEYTVKWRKENPFRRLGISTASAISQSMFFVLAPGYKKGLAKYEQERRASQQRIVENLNTQLNQIEEMNKVLSTKNQALQEAKLQVEYERKLLAYFVNNDVVNELNQGMDPMAYQPRDSRIAIMFCDVRNFTAITESTPSKDLANMLNKYFSEMLHAINESGGKADKLIGDGIMAEFPEPNTAIQAAVEMRSRINFCDGKALFQNGIGIDFSNLLEGNFGDVEHFTKLDRTVLGIGANLASRIESLNKYYGTHILISERVKDNLSLTRIRPVDRVTVKGMQEPFYIYEVYEGERTQEVADKDRINDDLAEGIALFYEREFSLARRKMLSIQKKLSGRSDPVVNIFVSRLAQLYRGESVKGLDENLVFHHSEK